MALYGLYFKDKSERVYKSDSFVPDEPTDKIEASSPIAARLNFVRKLKIPFKTFQNRYSVRKIASLDSLDINTREQILNAAAFEDLAAVPSYVERSELKNEQASSRDKGVASTRVLDKLPLSYRPAYGDDTVYDTNEVNQCKICIQYQAGNCRLFNAVVNPVYVCNSFGKSVAKRVPVDNPIIEVNPTPAELTNEDIKEQKRLAKRNPITDRFLTQEDKIKRAEGKSNPFIKGRKFGPRRGSTKQVKNYDEAASDTALDTSSTIRTNNDSQNTLANTGY